jgi:hypothetical protein
MRMRKRRTLSAIFAVLLAVPLAAVGVCGALASLAPSPAVCPVEADAAGDCCSRSSSPASSRTPAPDKCAACGAAACALGEARESARLARSAADSVADRPGVARGVLRIAAVQCLSFLAASPPRYVLLATFRN